jgi:cell division protein FtsB
LRVVRRALAPALVLAVVLGVLVVGVFPTRTLWAQRSATSDAAEQLSVLRRQTRALERRALELNDPEVIERIAREEYGYVRPGEEPYVVLPPPEPIRPPPEPEADDRNLLQKAWDGVTGLF